MSTRTFCFHSRFRFRSLSNAFSISTSTHQLVSADLEQQKKELVREENSSVNSLFDFFSGDHLVSRRGQRRMPLR